MTLDEAKAALYDKVNRFKDEVYIPMCVRRAPDLQQAADALNAAALAVHEGETVEEIDQLSAALDQFVA